MNLRFLPCMTNVYIYLASYIIESLWKYLSFTLWLNARQSEIFTEYPLKDSFKLFSFLDWNVERFQKLCLFARWRNIRAWPQPPACDWHFGNLRLHRQLEIFIELRQTRELLLKLMRRCDVSLEYSSVILQNYCGFAVGEFFMSLCYTVIVGVVYDRLTLEAPQ